MFHIPPHQKLKIGFISDLSGVYRIAAEEQKNGVMLALDEMVRGGGFARDSFSVIVKDSEINPDVTRLRTKELIEKDRVDILIGGLTASLHITINDETKKAGIPFMSIGQVHELTTSDYLGPYTFHQAYTPYMIGQAMGKWISENIGKKWFLFFTDYMWGWRVHDSYIAVAKRTGSEIVGYKRIPFPVKNESEYTKHFAEVLDSHADILIGNNFGADQVKFIQDVGRARLKRHVSVAVTLAEGTTFSVIDPDVAAGMYWGTTFYWGLEKMYDTARTFVSGYRKKFRDVPGAYAAYGYSAAHELVGAVLRIGKYPIQPDAVARELEGRSYAHYKSGEWWRPCDHQALQDFYILKVKGTEERTGKQDVAEIIGSTQWDLKTERTCEILGQSDRQWGHVILPRENTRRSA